MPKFLTMVTGFGTGMFIMTIVTAMIFYIYLA